MEVRLKKVLLLSWVCGCIFTLLRGQSVEPAMFHYDIEQGLPSSETYDCYQDSQGYIWVTSDRGISRFDGYEFRKFTSADGLKGNTYFHPVPVGDKIYFSGIDGNIDVIYGTKIINKTNNADQPIKKLKGWFDIIGISRDESTLTLVANAGEYIFEYQPKNGHINYIQPKWTRVNDTVALADFSNARLIRLLRKKDRDTSIIVCNKKDIHGNYWSVVSSNFQVIFSFKDQELITTMGLPGTRINKVQTINENLWICTNKGLFIYTPTGEFIRHFLQRYEPSSVNLDFENNIWVTTLNKGILRIPQGNVNIFSLPFLDHIREKIVCIKPVRDAICVVTSNGYYYFIDPIKQSLITWWCSPENLRPINISVLGDTIYSYTARIVYRNKKIQVFNTRNDPNPMRRKWGFGYTSARFGNGIILSAYHLSYSVWDPTFSTITDLRHIEFAHKVLDIINRDAEHCLLGTVNGLYDVWIRDLQHPAKVHLKGMDDDTRINRIQKFGNYFYLSTLGAGLVITNLSNTFVISEDQGLVSNLVHGVQFDHAGNLWVATNQGLSRMSIDINDPIHTFKKNIRNYSSSTGLNGNFISDLYIYNDKLWIATNNGLNILPASPNSQESFPPKMIIEKISANEHEMPYSAGKVMQLLWDENDLRIWYTGICFNKPIKGNFYRYRLLGLDHDTIWNYTDEREIQFTNLDPGKYLFEIQAQNNNRIWSNSGVFQFQIGLHFSQTLLFQIFVILLGIAIILLSVWSYFRRLKFRQNQLQKVQLAEIRQRESDLNTLRNQMNPHFVFNAMNSVQSLIYKGQYDEANELLVRFSRLLRDTLEFSKSNRILLKTEIEFLYNYLMIEKSRFPDLFGFQIRHSEIDFVDSVFIPPMMIQPVVENAVKHAFKHAVKQGTIDIEFKFFHDERYIEVVISDTGHGLNSLQTNANTVHKSFGLQIIKERLSLLNEKGYPECKMELLTPNPLFKTRIRLILPCIESE